MSVVRPNSPVRIVAHRNQPAPPVASVHQAVGTSLGHLVVAGSTVALLDVDVGELLAGLGPASARRVLAAPVILVLLVLLQLLDRRTVSDVVPGRHAGALGAVPVGYTGWGRGWGQLRLSSAGWRRGRCIVVDKLQ